MRNQVDAFIRLGQPKFLLESLLMVTLGLTVSVYSGQSFQLVPWLMVQLIVTGTHLMTQYCNEYFDLRADRAHTGPNRWTGGSRVLVSGELKPVVGLSAAFTLLFGVLVLVVLLPAPVERLIGLAGITLAWFYTAPPVRLNYRALGEITTSGALTVLSPLLVVYAQMKTVPPVLLALFGPMFLVMVARMIVMNFCDRESDLRAGKRTLPNTLGPRRAALLFTALQVTAYGVVVVVTAVGILPAPPGIGLLATAALAYPICRRLLTEPPSEADPAAAAAIARLATTHAAATGFTAVIGMIVAMAVGSGGGWSSSALVCLGIFAVYTLLFTAVQLSGGNRKAVVS
ncbi:prenyltransferase [Amycolatopsis cihanbeyliensis]|uniref:1,4-dihydroxy-2-naphthoate octaprenyltransferase n=1 Tax=Amycolatopsis cihanbeyliensis TaxID=1128664 RepID=A0A542DI54_AMYCI|nr:prenyltransferase [Amycolatopsis cihanbeyliensis]TQJ02778.1 1,4-dihydroxy-2-naphthoate octaprenyltransferase [Amycolatopsis cihanbeyliensis]